MVSHCTLRIRKAVMTLAMHSESLFHPVLASLGLNIGRL
jgi:hypothetical protein